MQYRKKKLVGLVTTRSAHLFMLDWLQRSSSPVLSCRARRVAQPLQRMGCLLGLSPPPAAGPEDSLRVLQAQRRRQLFAATFVASVRQVCCRVMRAERELAGELQVAFDQRIAHAQVGYHEETVQGSAMRDQSRVVAIWPSGWTSIRVQQHLLTAIPKEGQSTPAAQISRTTTAIFASASSKARSQR